MVYRHAPDYLAIGIPSENIFLAVDFFFCLSGFVIAFAYGDRLRSKLTLRDFIVARLIRFYPMFLIGTLLALITALGPAHLLTMPGGRSMVLASLPSLLFLPSVPLAPGFKLFPINMPSWTLFTELIANVAFGILLRRRLRTGVILTIIGVASWCELAFSPLRLDSGSTWPGLWIGLARTGFSFCAGVFVFSLWRKLPLGGLRRERGLVAAAVIVAVLLLSITLHTSFTGAHWYHLGVITVVMPALVFFGADVKLSPMCGRICGALGDLSYPLYIIHIPLLGPLFGVRVTHLVASSPFLRHVLVPVYDLGLAAFAWSLEAYLDVPIRRWLSRAYKSYKLSALQPQTLAPLSLTHEPHTAQ